MFKVIWDKESNGVRLTMAPPAGEALNVCPRPVFWEELDFYHLYEYGWSYPHSNNPLLWACDRRYYYKGQVVLEVNGGNLFDIPKINVLQANLQVKEIDIDFLKKINEDSMFLIEHEAMSFIFQTYTSHIDYKSKNSSADISFDELATKIQSKTNTEQTVIKEDCGSFDIMPLTKAEQLGKQRIFNSNIETVLVSFSGGKDSQVVLDLVSRVLPPSRFIIIYSNTGYELPTSISLYEDIKGHYISKFPELKFYSAFNHKKVLQYWDELDTPSKVHRWCCAVMKTAPLYRLIKEINGSGKQPNVLAFEGVRAEESSKRATYSRIGKGVKHNNVVNVRPIFEWSTTEVWLYLLFNGLPINEAYRKGLNRVGCVICPLSSELGDCLDHHFFPETARPFIDKLRENATKAGIRNIDTYLKERKWKVRAGGNRHESNTEISYEEKDSDLTIRIANPKEDFFQQIKQIVREPRLQRITKAPSSYSRQTAVEYDSGIDASQTKSKLSPWDFKQYLEKVNKLSGGDSYTNSSINVYTSATQSKYIRSKIEKYVVSGILYDLVDLSVLMNLMDDIMKDVAEDITPNSTLMAIKLYIQMLNDKELLVQSDDL